MNDKKILSQLKNAINNGNAKDINMIFELIYQKYHGLVRYVVFPILNNGEDVDDIVQESFVKLFENISKGNIRNIKYWLVTTSKNAAINYSKKQSRIEISDDIDKIEAHHQSSIKEMISSLSEVLNQEELDIVILHLVYNLTFREIARTREKTTNAISSKYKRAINKYKNKTKK